MSNKALVWVRDDFRINNNDALTYATNNHDIESSITGPYDCISVFK